jgi:hypothetical protein
MLHGGRAADGNVRGVEVLKAEHVLSVLPRGRGRKCRVTSFVSARHPERIDNAVAELLNLSKHPFGRRIVVEADGVGLIVDVVNVATKVEAWHNAVAVLFYLSSSVYCDKTSRVPEAVPTLVHLA